MNGYLMPYKGSEKMNHTKILEELEKKLTTLENDKVSILAKYVEAVKGTNQTKCKDLEQEWADKCLEIKSTHKRIELLKSQSGELNG